MKLFLVGINSDLVNEWEKAFDSFDDVTVLYGDILKVAENTIVSPANSYGFMDGGIDRLYSEFFGLRPQTEIQEAIKRREEASPYHTNKAFSLRMNQIINKSQSTSLP